jgi:hypothetical protein
MSTFTGSLLYVRSVEYPAKPGECLGGARRAACYDEPRVRFPFTLMGVMSLVLGAWVILYFLIRKPDGPVSGGIEVAIAFVMIGFGSWVVWRRLTGRERG